MPPEAPPRKPLKFFALVFALSIPFWLFGPMAEQVSAYLPMNLPPSAVMTFSPLIVALILIVREGRPGELKKFLRRNLDTKNISRKIWYLPIIFMMPIILTASYGLMRLAGLSIPEPRFNPLLIPLLFALFFITAVGEEAGWTGYVLKPLQQRWDALTTAVVIGVVSSIWHVVPYAQAGHPPAWITWQCVASVALRILTVWIYNNTGSLFAACLFHASINVSDTLFPDNGSFYDPAISGAIIVVVATAITYLWGPVTLARYRPFRSPEAA